jgi:hypothetical protein
MRGQESREGALVVNVSAVVSKRVSGREEDPRVFLAVTSQSFSHADFLSFDNCTVQSRTMSRRTSHSVETFTTETSSEGMNEATMMTPMSMSSIKRDFL